MEQELLRYTMKAAFYAEVLKKAEGTEKQAAGFLDALQHSWAGMAPAAQKALIGGIGGGALGAGAGLASSMAQPKRDRNSLRSALMGGIGGAGLGAGLGYLSENGFGGKQPSFTGMANAKFDTDPSKVPPLTNPGGGGGGAGDPNVAALKNFWDQNMNGQPANVQLANIQKAKEMFGPEAANSLMNMYEQQHNLEHGVYNITSSMGGWPTTTGAAAGGIGGAAVGAAKQMGEHSRALGAMNESPLSSRFNHWADANKEVNKLYNIPKGTTMHPGTSLMEGSFSVPGTPFPQDTNILGANLHGLPGMPPMDPQTQRQALNWAKTNPAHELNPYFQLPEALGQSEFKGLARKSIPNSIVKAIGEHVIPHPRGGVPTRFGRVMGRAGKYGAGGMAAGAMPGLLMNAYRLAKPHLFNNSSEMAQNALQ
jgi:hypothetical protein